MPLTECPDCGGVVSDAALTCPTCHRVLETSEPGAIRLARRWITWFALGMLAVMLVVVILRVTT
jgi:hypothetical protein